MQDFMGYLWLITMIAFIALIVIKMYTKVKYGADSEEYLKISWIKKIVGLVCVISFLGIGLADPDKHSDRPTTNVSQTSTKEQAPPTPPQETQEMKAEREANEAKAAQSQAEKKAASDEIRQILGYVPQQVDEVEHAINYQTWGEDKLPAQTAIWWSVQLRENRLTPIKIAIVHFTRGTNWVFWEQLTFSNGNSKWIKTLNTFAGQSGDGKHTQVVMGGKYETWYGPITEVRNGLEILAQDGKPILRLSGREYKDDVYLTGDDVERIRTALHLQELIEKIDYQLVE